jgi:hypothetical protein
MSTLRTEYEGSEPVKQLPDSHIRPGFADYKLHDFEPCDTQESSLTLNSSNLAVEAYKMFSKP